ncbi:MAG: glycerophosphodiester phosphodiesterase [Pirellulales bacterium]
MLRGRGFLDRVIVQSFDWEFLADCHQLAPELSLGALWREPLMPEHIHAARRLGASVIGWRDDQSNPAGIAAIHAAGLKVWVYTVDFTSRAKELIASGVDGLISNVPGEIIAVVRR